MASYACPGWVLVEELDRRKVGPSPHTAQFEHPRPSGPASVLHFPATRHPVIRPGLARPAPFLPSLSSITDHPGPPARRRALLSRLPPPYDPSRPHRACAAPASPQAGLSPPPPRPFKLAHSSRPPCRRLPAAAFKLPREAEHEKPRARPRRDYQSHGGGRRAGGRVAGSWASEAEGGGGWNKGRGGNGT